MSGFENIDILDIITLVIALTIAIVGHEIAHGWVAYKFKDNTAKNLGRLSINPIKHIDPFGTIIVPGLLYLTAGFVIGWAKPVPINGYTVIRNGGYKAMILVSLAGIIYNFILVTISFFMIKTGIFQADLQKFLIMLMLVNLILGLFNLYPIPPLDGSQAVEYTLRSINLHKIASLFSSLQRYGMIILILIIASPLKDYVFYPIRYMLEMVKFAL
ncbi:site-2 protease family protein [Campylobacter sp. RM16192]|uniref:site-2 protease family protein n=1 Tax=Campylobacter sp. RM16192 TaxID=1660080 RepID=UPI001452437D|nr:site-2 protease family protein [Campylobacter sp. RM16192]QCD52936.1 membrane-associated zinc metalloprotease, S2P/M50 family [Campylobacter sp. RM16192]